MWSILLSLLLLDTTLGSAQILRGFQNPTAKIKFANAVFRSYDPSQSFEENFVFIMSILCANSVACPGDSIDFSDTIQGVNNASRNVSLIEKARYYLEVHASSDVAGCCKRCSCDLRCHEKGNCCHGITDDRTDSETTINQTCTIASLIGYSPDAVDEKAYGIAYYMVTDCFSEYSNDSVVEHCRRPDMSDPSTVTPVLSNQTGRNYWNKYCAQCNYDGVVTPWTIQVVFPSYISMVGLVQIPDSPDGLFDLLGVKGKRIETNFLPPEPVMSRIKEYMCLAKSSVDISECTSDEFLEAGEAEFFNNICAYRTVPYMSGGRVFNNPFCYLCSPSVSGTKECEGQVKINEGFFAALFNTDRRRAVEDTQQKSGKCLCREFHDTKLDICRAVLCPPGTELSSCECQRFLTGFTGMSVQVFIDIKPEGPSVLDVDRDFISDKNTFKTVHKQIRRLFSRRWVGVIIEQELLYYERSESETTVYCVMSMRSEGEMDDMVLFKQVFNALKNGLAIVVNNIKLRFGFGPLCNVASDRDDPQFLACDERNNATLEKIFAVEAYLEYLRPRQILTKLMFCDRIRLTQSETQFLNNVSAFSLPDLRYIYQTKDSSMCFDDYLSLFVISNAQVELDVELCKVLCIIAFAFLTILIKHVL